MARLWRLYQPDLPETPGQIVDLGPEESKHALKVLRLHPGEAVSIFDGAGREWSARMLEAVGPGARLRLEREILEPVMEPRLNLELYQATLRPERMDWVVQKATEIGVTTIHPFVPERAERYRIGAERLSRWRRIAIESCKQCGRRRLPKILPIERLPRSDAADRLALFLHLDEAARPLAEQCLDPPPTHVSIAVGPQGGFTGSEADEFEALGWRPTALGPRVLRADTAGVVAAAILLHRWADLG
jgi:16S rRNA (uracil1498-N3)-methyltransferase